MVLSVVTIVFPSIKPSHPAPPPFPFPFCSSLYATLIISHTPCLFFTRSLVFASISNHVKTQNTCHLNGESESDAILQIKLHPTRPFHRISNINVDRFKRIHANICCAVLLGLEINVLYGEKASLCTAWIGLC